MAGGEALADLGSRDRKLHGDPRGPSAASHRLSEGQAVRPSPTGADPSSRIGAGLRTQLNAAPAARSSTMKIALDPFMHRHLSLEELPSKVAELGYEWIELSPRGDFLEWFKAPRVFPDRIKAFKKALSDANVGIASLLPMYRWASNDEDGAPGGGAPLEARHRDRRRDGRRHDELRVRPRPAPGQGLLLLLPIRLDDRGLRGRLVALDGGAGADLREGGHQPPHRAASRGLDARRCSRRSTSSARSTASA